MTYLSHSETQLCGFNSFLLFLRPKGAYVSNNLICLGLSLTFDSFFLLASDKEILSSSLQRQLNVLYLDVGMSVIYCYMASQSKLNG